VSDETLAAFGEARREKDGDFSWICLRPGLLAGGGEGEETGKVRMGKIGIKVCFFPLATAKNDILCFEETPTLKSETSLRIRP